MDGGGDNTIRLGPRVAIPAGLVRWSFARSGGPGGQNVNKVASKAELRVRLADVPINAGTRRRLEKLASHMLAGEGDELELVVTCDEHRSQKRNREGCVEKLGELVRRAMVVPKVRKKTRPSRGAVERRIKEKKERGQIKQRRKGPGPNEH